MQQPYQLAEVEPDYAGVGSRSLAFVIDAFVLSTVSWLMAGMSGTTIPVHPVRTIFGFDVYVSGPLVVGVGLFVLLYFVVMEGALGYTPGKYVMGLRVISADGFSLSWGQAIVRNVLLPVDALVGYLVGVICIWATERRQRVGDLVAKTVVVHV